MKNSAHWKNTSNGNIAILTLDCPDKPINLFSKEVMRELFELVSELRNLAVKGLIFRSAKQTFTAGADITEFPEIIQSQNRLDDFIARGNVFQEIASLPFPTVIAINGMLVGAGMELAMACDYRICVTGEYKFMLPETKLGVIPGWGGTAWLPRLIGIKEALNIICFGNSLTPMSAKECGFVDDVVPFEQLLASAETMVNACKSEDLKNLRAKKMQAIHTFSVDLFEEFEARCHELKHGFDAAIKALQVIRNTATFSFKVAKEEENQALADLILSPNSTVPAMLNAYLKK